ncbi:dynamin family protein [Alicyclobacillus tolerans]|uniref:Small GTP-binding protein n=1 Tax=Alicyclobacillus tolerans TaxID=90970 RepID=A0ABT9LTL4_9BACL|nr:dynamin family protein [Alicyclobacillus tengchongensis]MDP9727598.1 small GTP-binding protein [Alicyclobacillus tengchongensis]
MVQQRTVADTAWTPESERALNQVCAEMEEQGQNELSERLRAIVNPLREGQWKIVVAFCGLFSAGKSSLINALTGASLATGAVPTTAKVETAAMVNEELGCEIDLLDTPGIDSTDASHEAETLAHLYLADLVALVMDYQHVEADEHLEWAKRLQDEGKRLILIVHQVDKHLDFELSFEEYQERVETAFSAFGVEPERIFYTSTRPSPYSQIVELQSFLLGLAHISPWEKQFSIYIRVQEILRQFAQICHQEEWQKVQEDVMDIFGQFPENAQEARQWLETRSKSILKVQKDYQLRLDELQDKWNHERIELARLIELAQISPYETTELGRKYVESLRSDFRVGWFGREKKTEQEREQRIQNFLNDLTDRAQKNLFWPLQSALRAFLQEELSSGTWDAAQLDNLTVPISSELLQRQIKSGALVSADYGYQYVRDVVAAIRGQTLARLQMMLDDYQQLAIVQLQEEEQSIKQTFAPDVEACRALNAWLQVYESIEREWRQKLNAIPVFSEVGAG